MVQQERFSRLQYPVHKITAKTPVELFQILPGLRRYFQRLVVEDIPIDETGKNKVEGYAPKYRGIFIDDLVKIIKYIVFVYDPESDILTEYPDDLRLMKEAAAKEAGFKRNNDGEWPDYIQKIFEFKEKEVVLWIMDYLKVKKNPIWTNLKMTDEELDTLNNQRAAAIIKGEIKSDLMKLIKERTDERSLLIKQFYAEHTDLKRTTQDEMFPVSPENVFKEMKIPDDIAKVRQVKDVPKDTGIQEAHH